MIALVVTIIILIILVSISMNVLLGENGILSRTSNAKEIYSKAEVKEKVKLLLSEYSMEKVNVEKKDFSTFLRRNLKVAVSQEKNGQCSFIFGNYMLTVSEYDILSIKKFSVHYDKVYASVSDMKKDENLKNGNFVYTKGYYSSEYGGAAYYNIVSNSDIEINNTTCIQLNNGLYAILYAINNTISVNQFGAYGDGIHDDSFYIKAAFDSGYSNVEFESEIYKLGKTLSLDTDNINIFGNDAILFTENDFQSTKEWCFLIQANNIDIYNLQMEARENIEVGYKTQLGVIKSNNVYIYESNFTVPETAPSSKMDGTLKEYTNIDLYSDWSNIKIDNCTLQVLHDGEAGGCIWIRDIWNLGCENLEFENNKCHKISHDEILAVYIGSIKNVKILNNTFEVEEKDASPSVMNFTLGSENSTVCDNIQFEGNRVNTMSSGGLIWSTNATNVNIENNTINYTRSISATITSYVFKGTITNISNNTIVINNDREDDAIIGFQGEDLNIKDNNLEFNSDISYCFSTCKSIIDNRIILNRKCSNIFNNLIEVCSNNEIEINSYINHFFQWYNNTFLSDVIVENNNIEYNYDEISNGDFSYFIMINGCICNNKTVTFLNNNLRGDFINSSGYLLYYSIKDTSPQTLILKNNLIDTYIKKYVPVSIHNVNTE